MQDLKGLEPTSLGHPHGDFERFVDFSREDPGGFPAEQLGQVRVSGLPQLRQNRLSTEFSV